jgi:hypothetical protein
MHPLPRRMVKLREARKTEANSGGTRVPADQIFVHFCDMLAMPPALLTFRT